MHTNPSRRCEDVALLSGRTTKPVGRPGPMGSSDGSRRCESEIFVGAIVGKNASLRVQGYGSQLSPNIGIHEHGSYRRAKDLRRNPPRTSSGRQGNENVQSNCGQPSCPLRPLALFDPAWLHPFHCVSPARTIPRPVVDPDPAVTDDGSIQGDPYRTPRPRWAGGAPPFPERSVATRRRPGWPPARNAIPGLSIPSGKPHSNARRSTPENLEVQVLPLPSQH